MIRGIILLILSCVVSTLATEKFCTCHKHPEPVYEQSQRDFPTPAVKNLDFTERPNDCSDLTRFYTDVSRPNNAFIRETSTSLLGGLISGVVELIFELLKRLDYLLDTHAAFLWQWNLFGIVVDDIFDDIIYGKCIHDPMCASQVVDRLLVVRTKKRQMEHTRQYLEKSISAAQTRHEMLTAEKNILGQYEQVSREIDSRQKSCKSGGGGLLGGILGGGNTCTRGAIIDGLVGNLLNAVVNLVLNLLNTILTALSHFLDALNILNHELDLLNLIPGLFDPICDDDLTDNDIRQKHVYHVMERLQNHHFVPLTDVKRNMANIMSNPKTVRQYITLPDELVKGFKFNNHHMSCIDENGDDLSIHLNVLDIIGVHLNWEISCKCSVGIKIDADLNDGVSLHIGATEWLDNLKLVTSGILGVHLAETSIDSLIDGVLTATLSISGQKNLAMNDALININAGLDLAGITLGVNVDVLRISDNLASFQDVTAIRHAIQDTHTKMQEEYNLGTEKNDDIESLVLETVESKTNQMVTHGKGIEIIDLIDDVVKTATESVRILTSNTNTNYRQLECAFKNYQRSIHIAEARALACQKELLQVELRRLHDPTNEDLIEICAALKIQLTDQLHDILVLKKLHLSVKADLEVRAALFGGNLLKLCVDLDVNVKSLAGGVIKTVTDLLGLLGDDSHTLIGPIESLVTATRKTISNLEILHLDLDVGDILTFEVNLDDVPQWGESVEHMEHMHQKIIQSAFAAGCQNPHVYVSGNDVTKRAIGSNTCHYTVTVRNDPGTNVARATEETGMTATTTETTSSASSLVCSFLVLFVSVLCFF